ncbi:hypothetical protein SAMN05444004_11566 [Jannaschia faecimaris]|uniref:Lipoprotein n=1 Tax=Jannaschia faecimaris TaxID=1244108 RepID=A0A1H3T7I7_9RHOB|nr:hypothetical protein [Jannaschia faecimaris]SDZ46206.1 hypothetical protein SAMN05444004_11566 [Jannaschia faecimaris]
MLRLIAIIALPLPLLLVSCAPTPAPVWLKPGTASLRAEQDFLACAAQARRDFPERHRIATAPRVTIGGGLCRSGLCVGVNDTPDVFDTDHNEPLRQRAVEVCMQAQGYRQENLPACPAGPVAALQSMPFDTRGLCVANGRIAAPWAGPF